MQKKAMRGIRTHHRNREGIGVGHTFTERERERERKRNVGTSIAYNIVGDSFSAIAPGVYTAI